MVYITRRNHSVSDKAMLWDMWQRGDSLKASGRRSGNSMAPGLLNWSNAHVVDHITQATLSFSDGSSVSVDPFSNDGGADEINFAPRSITTVRLTVNAVGPSTVSVDLDEIEVFDN